MKHTLSLSIVLSVLLFTSCLTQKHDFDNPLDPDGVNFKSWPAPTLAAPEKAMAGAQYKVIWIDVGASSYSIEESDNTSFTNATSHTVSGLSYSFSHDEADKTYYYRVKTNTGEKDSGWSKTLTVAIIEGTTSNIIFVSIPGGTFQMGNVENASEGDSDETPVHSVMVSSFEIGVYEVANAQYASYLNEALSSGDITASSSSVKGAKGVYSGQEYLDLSGSYDTNNKCWITYSNGTFTVVSGKENWPVVYVTWYGAKSFALYYGLDLTTEAEWEYACRGGKQFKYGTDDGTISSYKANYNSNISYPVDVGSYPKNPFGLYDMSGNVWEWCHDWYGSYSSGSVSNPSGAQTGTYRVIRGGSWRSYGLYCRSAGRVRYYPGSGGDDVGFRVVRRSSPQNY